MVEDKVQEPLTSLGFKPENSTAVVLAPHLKTGKQVELLSFSLRARSITGIFLDGMTMLLISESSIL